MLGVYESAHDDGGINPLDRSLTWPRPLPLRSATGNKRSRGGAVLRLLARVARSFLSLARWYIRARTKHGGGHVANRCAVEAEFDRNIILANDLTGRVFPTGAGTHGCS